MILSNSFIQPQRLSTNGIDYAGVFPLPVTAYQILNLLGSQQSKGASTSITSLCAMNRGIVEVCTGVIRLNPMPAAYGV